MQPNLETREGFQLPLWHDQGMQHTLRPNYPYHSAARACHTSLIAVLRCSSALSCLALVACRARTQTMYW